MSASMSEIESVRSFEAFKENIRSVVKCSAVTGLEFCEPCKGLSRQRLLVRHSHLRRNATQEQIHCCLSNSTRFSNHALSVARIEPYGGEKKYKVIFSEKVQAITPIPFSDAPLSSMQGLRYTSFSALKNAKKLTDLL